MNNTEASDATHLDERVRAAVAGKVKVEGVSTKHVRLAHAGQLHARDAPYGRRAAHHDVAAVASEEVVGARAIGDAASGRAREEAREVGRTGRHVERHRVIRSALR